MDENKAPEAAEQKLDVSVRVYPVKESGNLLAFASATLGGCFAVNGIRVYDGEKGKFVAMPSRKDKEDKYHDICCPTTKEMRQALNAAVLEEYQRAVEQPEMDAAEQRTEKPSLRSALQNAAKDVAARSNSEVYRTAEKGAR